MTHQRARTNSQPSNDVDSTSNVVVVTKWSVASEIADTAATQAAITCARRPPPASRAIAPATITVAAAATADGSRSRYNETAMRCISPGKQGHERRLIRITERWVRPGDDEVHLVNVLVGLR
jgi:hypothetical protein